MMSVLHGMDTLRRAAMQCLFIVLMIIIQARFVMNFGFRPMIKMGFGINRGSSFLVKGDGDDDEIG